VVMEYKLHTGGTLGAIVRRSPPFLAALRGLAKPGLI